VTWVMHTAPSELWAQIAQGWRFEREEDPDLVDGRVQMRCVEPGREDFTLNFPASELEKHWREEDRALSVPAETGSAPREPEDTTNEGNAR
jgi:hypothetical protein